jgi:putative ABC transport system permease protein
MRIPLLRGRNFDSRDYQPAAPRTLIVNQEMAKGLFPNEDPIGKRLVVAMGESASAEIVGITGNILHDGFDGEIRPMVYYPNPQLPLGYATFVIRTGGDPMSLAKPAIAAIHAIDADQPVIDLKTMQDRLTDSTAKTRYTMLLLAIFAAVAMAMAAAGIYGVTSYTVARRTREIGIRMALGAQREDVWRMVIVQGLVPVIAGLATGMAGALALTRLLNSLLFGVGARDAVTYAGVTAFLVLVALLACLVPARRATTVDPAGALSYE